MTICLTPLSELQDRPIYVVPPYLPAYQPQDIVERALDLQAKAVGLEERWPYSLFDNNCEHFVTGVIYGFPHSLQIRTSHNCRFPVHWGNTPKEQRSFPAWKPGAGFLSMTNWIRIRTQDGIWPLFMPS